MGRASWVHGQIFMGQFCGNAVRVKQNKLGVEYVSPIVCVSINRAQSCNCCLPKEEEGKEESAPTGQHGAPRSTCIGNSIAFQIDPLFLPCTGQMCRQCSVQGRHRLSFVLLGAVCTFWAARHEVSCSGPIAGCLGRRSHCWFLHVLTNSSARSSLGWVSTCGCRDVAPCPGVQQRGVGAGCSPAGYG